MKERGNRQYGVIEKLNEKGQPTVVWSGHPSELPLGSLEDQNSKVYGVIEQDGSQVRKIPLNVSPEFLTKAEEK